MHEHGSDSGSARRTVEIGDDRMLRVGGSTAVFDRHDSTSLLTSYLLLVRKLRKQRREPAVVLRSDDIVVLASYLGEPAAVVIERLGALMGATRTQRTAMVTLFASGALVIGLATAATATGTVRGGTSASHASAPADREATPSTAAPMATGDGADGGEAATAAVVFVDRYDDDGGTSDGPSAGLDDRGTSQNRKGRRGAARADDARTADPPAPPADDPAFTGSDEPADPTSTPPVSSGPDDTEPASPASESPHLAAPPTIAAPSPTEVGNDPAPASNDESGNDGSGNDGSGDDGSGDDGSGTDEEDDSPLVTIDPISEVDPAAPTDESTNPPTDEGPAAGGTDSTCGPMDR